MAGPENIAAREAEIQKLVGEDRRDDARAALFELIVTCARSGDLENANRLRDLLYEIDPMALNDVIKANEMIEEAMSGAISDSFNKAWTGLRSALTEEEFLALYHTLVEHDIEAGKSIVKAGSKLDALFFINQGNVSVTCQCGDGTVEAGTLEPGTMASENCFQPSVWTVSLRALSPVNLSILRLEKLVELEEKFPGLERKLIGFYESFETIWQRLAEQEKERRRVVRSRADQKVVFQVLSKDGSPDERTFRGELDNLSVSGLAFVIRIVKRENRRMLFGRRIVVTVQSENGKVQFTGTVVAVSCYDIQDHDYAVHVAFDQPVAGEVVQPFLLPEPAEEDELSELDGEGESADEPEQE